MMIFYVICYESNSIDFPDYQYISRCVRCLIGLGESAFREILPYLCQINTNDAPDWILNDFSVC